MDKITEFRFTCAGGIEYQSHLTYHWFRITESQMMQLTAKQLRLVADAMEHGDSEVGDE